MKISIKKINKDLFEVHIQAKSSSNHEVSISDLVYKNLTNEMVSKEILLEFSINFLLEKESNTSILENFQIMLINQYFPDYKSRVRNWMENIK